MPTFTLTTEPVESDTSTPSGEALWVTPMINVGGHYQRTQLQGPAGEVISETARKIHADKTTHLASTVLPVDDGTWEPQGFFFEAYTAKGPRAYVPGDQTSGATVHLKTYIDTPVTLPVHPTYAATIARIDAKDDEQDAAIADLQAGGGGSDYDDGPIYAALATETASRIGADSTNTTAISTHTGRTDNPHAVTKAQVGLGSVDNTSDAAKPVSTAQATAISTAINGLINGAPGALDTLHELADAMGDDPNFATTVTNALAGKVPTTRTVAGHALSADVTLTASDVGVAAATTTASGLVELATDAEAIAGTAEDLAVTPAGVLAAIQDNAGPVITEDPDDAGTYLIGGTGFTEDPDDVGTYLIGA